jgi:hypothetical protein
LGKLEKAAIAVGNFPGVSIQAFVGVKKFEIFWDSQPTYPPIIEHG